MNELEAISGLVEPHVLPREDPFRAAISLAEALRRIHREGAVCGCLNPAHIAWDKSGVRLYQNGASGLTPYLSPEQLRGEAADARSDIFAFGAILYELFSGQRAFPAHGPEELQRQILEHSPTPLTGLPEQISQLVAGCLEKKPQDRWQRINPILIELKLTSSTARQAQSAAESKGNIASLRAQVGAHDERFTAHAAAQQAQDAERRRTLVELQESLRSQGMDIGEIRATLSALHESIAGLHKGAEIHTKAIEGLGVAASQTDEVVEHVVEAFGKLYEAMGERGEAKVLAREAEAESPPGRSFGSLAERIQAGPIPLAEALRYAIELAEALREVHARGRIHAALHPANVSLEDSRAQLMFSTQMAVSPYFSPEQVAGRDLDARTDIFSLGALAYEMLAGRKAFDAPTKPALRLAILDRDPAPLAGVPPALSRLIARCLEKKPERRLQRMEVLLAELKLQEILARAAKPLRNATAS